LRVDCGSQDRGIVEWIISRDLATSSAVGLEMTRNLAARRRRSNSGNARGALRVRAYRASSSTCSDTMSSTLPSSKQQDIAGATRWRDGSGYQYVGIEEQAIPARFIGIDWLCSLRGTHEEYRSG